MTIGRGWWRHLESPRARLWDGQEERQDGEATCSPRRVYTVVWQADSSPFIGKLCDECLGSPKHRCESRREVCTRLSGAGGT